MKKIIFLITLLSSFEAFCVWDMLIAAKPDKSYMNFFYKGYVPWFEKSFDTKLAFPDDKDGDFFKTSLNLIDHWKVPGHPKFDQLLIGESQSKDYSITMYLHDGAKNHLYIQKQKLPFTPDFISWNGKELCFLSFNETPGWRHLPRDGKDYLSHFCKESGRFVLKYVSFISSKETKTFKNPFEGLIEWEITKFDKTKQVSSFFFVKTLHMAFIPKNFYHYIMEHGAKTHMPLDKYSIDQNNEMQVYYP